MGAAQSVDDSNTRSGKDEDAANDDNDAEKQVGKDRKSRTYRMSQTPVRGRKTRLNEVLPKVGMRESQIEEIVAGEQLPALARLDTLLDELREVDEKRENLKKVKGIAEVHAKQNGQFPGWPKHIVGIMENVLAPESSFNLSMKAWEFKELTTRKKEIEEELEALTQEIRSTYESPAEIYTRNFEALEGDAYFTTMVALDQCCLSLDL